MANLGDHQSNNYVKLLAIGDSKAGKTGSLVSLVKAGYKLRILDTDNLLDVLKYFLLQEPDGAELVKNVEFRTLRDKRKATKTGAKISGTPKAFIEAVGMLEKWKYKDGDVEVDLGNPGEWGPDCILVIDSLTRLCDAAYDWADTMNVPGRSGDKDGRVTYGASQDAVEDMLSMLTDDAFETNVIVIGHVKFIEVDGVVKGYPTGIGAALSPLIPTYFPSYVLYQNKGGKRTIQTSSTPLLDLANPAPMKMEKSYPIETGLASFFEALRPPPKKDITKVTLVKQA